MNDDRTTSTASAWPRRVGENTLRRSSSADHVSAHVRRAIISGELVSGERLSPNEIAAEFGISRVPVREALIALDREGWVQREPNVGVFVASIAGEDVRDHYELRGLVFGLIARRVAGNATDEDLASLQSRLTTLRHADDGLFPDLNDRFLGTLFGIADSPRLVAALLVSPSILPEGFFDVVPQGRDVQLRGLTALVEALRARDASAADRAMRRLLTEQGSVVAVALDARLAST